MSVAKYDRDHLRFSYCCDELDPSRPLPYHDSVHVQPFRGAGGGEVRGERLELNGISVFRYLCEVLRLKPNQVPTCIYINRLNECVCILYLCFKLLY
jgi:hypothetical protein